MHETSFERGKYSLVPAGDQKICVHDDGLSDNDVEIAAPKGGLGYRGAE
jgi:hypothetical protein